MLSLCKRNHPWMLENIDLPRLHPFCQRYLRRLSLGSWAIYWLQFLQFSYGGAWNMWCFVHSISLSTGCSGVWTGALREGLLSCTSQPHLIETLLFILCYSKLFHIVRNYIVNYADDTAIYVVIDRLLLHPLSDGIPESVFGSNQPLVFEVAHEASP